MEVGSVTVGEGLIKNQVGQLQTTERRGVGKTCVETDGAVRDVDAVLARDGLIFDQDPVAIRRRDLIQSRQPGKAAKDAR